MFREKFLLAAVLLGSGSAWADHPGGTYYPPGSTYDRGWYTCDTSSNGYTFRNASDTVDDARRRVLQDCTSNWNTSAGSCRYNVKCEGEYPGAWAKCATTSNGYTFRDGGADVRSVRDAVIQACTSNWNTNTGSCRANVSCEGGYPPAPPTPYPPTPYPPAPPTPYPPTPPTPYPPTPYPPAPPTPYPPTPPTPYPPQPPYEDPNRNYVCSTTSNGRSFSVPGRGYAQTRAKVVAVCQSNGFTNPYECDRNASCQ